MLASFSQGQILPKPRTLSLGPRTLEGGLNSVQNGPKISSIGLLEVELLAGSFCCMILTQAIVAPLALDGGL